MKLREYQQAAVDAVYDHLRNRDDNPVAVLPTGAGKSLVLAKIASDAVNQWNGRVLILAHVKELLEQNADKVRRLCPDINVGLYSAGLKKRDTNTPVLVAGIQSIYRRACDLDPFDLIVVDEAHLISKKGDGTYRQFLADCKVINPRVRVIGLTATPFRLDSGMICSPDHFLNNICYEIGIKELIRDGYLCSLVSKAGINRADFSSVHLRAGEFVADEVDRLAGDEALVSAACAEIVELTVDRWAVLIFATSVAHGRQVVETLRDNHGIECGFVTGQTPADERDELLARFRGDASTSLLIDEPLRFLCNVNVLTTGFDAPRVDCVVMLRPTMSPGLLYQCVGRGFRLHPDKQNCLVLDFGGNIERHGPIDQIKPKEKATRPDQAPPAKECEKCHALVACGYANCPECGHPFPPPEREAHDAKASEAGVLSGEVNYLRQHQARFPNHPWIRMTADFLKLCRRLESLPHLREVSGLPSLPKPNYVLLHENRYKQVWRSYMEVIRQQRRRQHLWIWRHEAFMDMLTVAWMNSASRSCVDRTQRKTAHRFDLRIRETPLRGTFFDWAAPPPIWRISPDRSFYIGPTDSAGQLSSVDDHAGGGTSIVVWEDGKARCTSLSLGLADDQVTVLLQSIQNAEASAQRVAVPLPLIEQPHALDTMHQQWCGS